MHTATINIRISFIAAFFEEFVGKNKFNKFSRKNRKSSTPYCKKKFIEWEQVAKSNRVSDFKKGIDAIFPDVEIWWVGLEW